MHVNRFMSIARDGNSTARQQPEEAGMWKAIAAAFALSALAAWTPSSAQAPA